MKLISKEAFRSLDANPSKEVFRSLEANPSKEAFRFLSGGIMGVLYESPPIDAPSRIARNAMVVVSSEALDDPASDSFRGRSAGRSADAALAAES